MRQILLLQAIILIGTNGFSQTLNFTVASPQPNIIEAYGGVFASGDINGDGHKDLLMTTNSKQTKIYSNNGTGSFTELSHNLPRSSQGQAIFKDLDNDFDLDLFFSGANELNQPFTNIYRNNGFGVFTQVPNALPITTYTRVALFDVDSDGDQDMVLSTPSAAGVYLNNGNAVFTPQSNSAFTLVGGILESIDLDNDGDKDVIISGGNSTKLYRNNGSGNFTLVTNTSLPAISAEDIDVVAMDIDGDFDFLINGNFQNLFYLNNGSGVFTTVTTTLQQTSSEENAILPT